jgi:hypothetical protein
MIYRMISMYIVSRIYNIIIFGKKKQKIKTGNQTTREPGLCLSLCMLRPLCPRLISYISFHRILSGRPPHT